jgi:hypothetical protein
VVSEEHGPDVVKWYTRARRFPQLIGRTPDGARIPGGPYTLTQAVAAGLILVIGLNTMGIWARFGLVGTIVTLTVTWTAVWLLGRIPVGSRNPLSAATGLAHAVGTPPTGRLGGHAVRVRRPRRLRHTVVLALTDTTDLTPAADRAPDSAPVTLPAETTPAKRRVRFPGRPRPAGPPGPPQQARPTAEAPPAAQESRRAPLTGVQALLAAHPTTRGIEETHR